MKKLFVVGLVMVLIAAVFVVPVLAQGEKPPSDPSALTVPLDLERIIQLFVGVLVVQGFKAISKRFGKDLSGNAAAISYAITSAVILFLNSLLGLVPDAAGPAVTVFLSLLVAIFGGWGLKDTIKSFAPVPVK